MAASSALFLLLAPLVLLWALSRRFPRGSHARLWARLWWFTLRERLRSIRRAALGVQRNRQALGDVRSQGPFGPRPQVHGGPPALRPPARDGVWVGNVFRPRAFEQHRMPR